MKTRERKEEKGRERKEGKCLSGGGMSEKGDTPCSAGLEP